MRRALIVGQAPSRVTVGLPPLSGRSGRFLARLAAVPSVSDAFDVVNVCGEWRGKRGKGDAAPETVDERCWRALARHAVWIILGRAAARLLLGKASAAAPFLRWQRRGGNRVVVVPHPSGIVRWWNDPANRQRAARVLRRAALGEREVMRWLSAR